MEPQQPQRFHYQYEAHQQQPQTETLTSQAASYGTSQIQSYDHSYYDSYHQQYSYTQPHQHQQQQQQQQQDYSSYYYPNYYQTQVQTDPNLIHPPGVPILNQTHVPNPHNLCYPSGVVASPPPLQGYMPVGGNQAGRSSRGRGTFGRHGRGRGGGRGKHVMLHNTRFSAPAATSGASSVAEGQAASSKPPPRMAWCEICRTDCTTLEVLEQHKNGKRHKRNLKVHEELQNLSRHLTMQDPKISASQPTPKTVSLFKAVGSCNNHPSNENVAITPTAPENKGEATTAEKDTAEKPETVGVLPSRESVKNDRFAGRGGLKRRIRGGRGGKWMRTFDGSRRIVEPPKPKQVVPLICNLCNVKCESQVVFESHITGKKHLANMKRFQGHKEALGEGIQALYPTIINLPSTSIPQPNQQGPHNAQSLASMMLSQQNLQDPQATHAALAQLLHQHGIHDAQTLITQLAPYLLTQSTQVHGQPGVSLPVPAVECGIDAQQTSLSQGAHIFVGAESHSVSVEDKTEQQNVSNVESLAVVGMPDKPADVPPENGSQH